MVSNDRFARLPALVSVTMLTLAGMLTGNVDAASAATLITSPFPADSVQSGTVACVTANVGTKNANVTTELVESDGHVLATSDFEDMPPGMSGVFVSADIPQTRPAFCRFTFKGKVRGSLTYSNGSGPPAVIPAEK